MSILGLKGIKISQTRPTLTFVATKNMKNFALVRSRVELRTDHFMTCGGARPVKVTVKAVKVLRISSLSSGGHGVAEQSTVRIGLLIRPIKCFISVIDCQLTVMYMCDCFSACLFGLFA